MSEKLPREMIVTLALVVIVVVGLALSWAVVRRLEAWSGRRKGRRLPGPSAEFRAVADWMARPEQVSRKRK